VGGCHVGRARGTGHLLGALDSLPLSTLRCLVAWLGIAWGLRGGQVVYGFLGGESKLGKSVSWLRILVAAFGITPRIPLRILFFFPLTQSNQQLY
jgi:hypothetical protein